MNKRIVIALLLVVAVMGMSSCDLFYSLFVPYVGTWENVTSTDVGDATWETKTTMVFTYGTFERIVEIDQDDGNGYEDVLAMKGSLSTEADEMLIPATHYREVVDGVFSNSWTALSADDAAFIEDTYTYSVDGDELTLTPENGDDKVYTRVD